VRADVTAGWSRLETENFEFVGNADEASIRTVADRLERFRSALGKVLVIGRSASRTRVIVFKDAAGFRAFKPLKTDGTPDDKVLGLFVAGQDFNTIAVTADNLDLGTIYHEYVHDVVAESFGTAQVPPWLNEGLAAYFQTFQISDEKTATFGSPRPEYQTLLRTTPLIPWDEFFTLDNFTLHRDGAASRPIFYAQAWAVASYLVNNSEPMHNFPKGMVSPSSLLAASDKIDRSKLSDLLSVAGTEPTIRPIEFVGSPPPYRIASEPVTEALANAILGDLHFRQRNPAAEAFLAKAVQLDPKLAATYSTFGQLRLRERKFGEAKAFLEKAIALDSRSHLPHFAYAFLLLRENLDQAAMLRPLKPEIAAKIRDSVTRSIALNERFAETHNLQATVEFSSGDIALAESAIRRAATLKPGNQNYALLLSQVLLRQEKADEAVRIAELLVSKPTDARIKAEANTVLKDAGELLAAKHIVKEQPQIKFAGYRAPVIVQYRDLTAEQVAKIDRDREIFNFNILIDRPTTSESYAVGYIDRIDCVDERIEFRVRSGAARLNLSTNKFDDVRFRVAVPGTKSFAFRCGTRLPNDLVVIVYKAAKSRAGGQIIAVSFVPPDFVFLTAEELSNAPYLVVEGRPSVDISENAAIAEKEREAMEREMRETQIRDIAERLRQRVEGEERFIGIPEKLECSAGRTRVQVRLGETLRSFSSPIIKPFEVQSFSSEAQLIEVGCGAQLPRVSAVITYRKADNELISVEFVPAWFTLR
jgi:tetratricopeptide (TPR) repeat protein